MAAGAKLKLLKKTTRLSGVASYGDFGRSALAVHSLTHIDQVVREVADACSTQWGWSATGLLILNHAPARAAGRAWDPGSGVRRNQRIISIGRDILQNYDLTLIGRIVAHELCHHYREETWPRDLERYTPFIHALKVHDERFCEALGKIDPIVRNSPDDCRQFNDEMWEGGRKKQSIKQGATIAPRDADVVLRHLKSGEFRFAISHIDGGRAKSIPLGVESLEFLFTSAGWTVDDLDGIIVHADDRARRTPLYRQAEELRAPQMPRILDMLRVMTKRYP